jgi:hypothetical protein
MTEAELYWERTKNLNFNFDAWFGKDKDEENEDC